MATSPQRGFQSKPLVPGALGWAGLYALYMMLAGETSGPEWIAGALGATAATIALIVSGNREHLGRMRLSWWWLVLKRVAPAVIRDTATVLMAAIGRSSPPGGFRCLAFEPGGDDGESGSRRALVVAGASVAPDSYVVTIDRDRNALLIHELVPRGRTQEVGDPQWPI